MQVQQNTIPPAQGLRPGKHLTAALVTAVLPATLGFLYLWLLPSGCALGREPWAYRWTCLLPGLMIVVPIGIALVLLAANLVAARLAVRLPGGWLTQPLAAGLFSHVVLIGAYVLALEPAYRGDLLGELLMIPQPFVAGFVAGVVYWLTLRATRP